MGAAKVPAIVQASDAAGLNPGAILGIAGGLIMIVMVILNGWTIIVTTLTVIYPALHSIRAIESNNDDDDKVWLTYWMVFGVFNVLETFVGFIFWFIPYWGYIRVALFFWVLSPNFKGAKTI